jgi:hypothetical protein
MEKSKDMNYYIGRFGGDIRLKGMMQNPESRFLTPELPALGAFQPEMSVFGWIPGSNRMRR